MTPLRPYFRKDNYGLLVGPLCWLAIAGGEWVFGMEAAASSAVLGLVVQCLIFAIAIAALDAYRRAAWARCDDAMALCDRWEELCELKAAQNREQQLEIRALRELLDDHKEPWQR